MDYHALVVGGGHAGIEASLALSRIGFKTLLVTQNLDAIGRLSCNPAIGGLSKGNIVREVDALGGEMAHLIDQSMIQFRILNRKRGPAVQAPRAQADKYTYARLAKETVEAAANLSIFMDTVTDLLVEGGKCIGVRTKRGHDITASVVVLTTGTFMEGRIFIGEYDAPEGRLEEPAAIGLGTALRRRGFPVGRLKTGTPARVRKSTVDLEHLEIQSGDDEMMSFSFDYTEVNRPSVPCHITWTNEKTHEIITANIKRSPLYGGKIVGLGPRYCPSIEDKVVRFPDRDRHQIFVEPEGLGTEELYLNGISSSLPEDVQQAFIHTIEGLEEAQIMRPGYAVEYDYIDPQALLLSLESKILENLFIAGQTNGTSGYEEAACQGLIAGINAAQKLKGEKPLILGRNEAYTGVLIDDLVTLGTEEPYRMFTSRAEYRLNLRHDNADQRLTQKGYDVGLQREENLQRLKEKVGRIESVKDLLRRNRHAEKSAFDALKMPEVTIELLSESIEELRSYPSSIRYEVELDVKYAGYIQRQERQINRFERFETMAIPADLDYDHLEGLSTEARQKLKKIRPMNVGQATRISGLRSSDTAILVVHLQKRPAHG
ncbi:MAG: tRNA uridine-5-carboxymethylaminomethyl(34) synthesis enzyme MnmG [Sphaerochaeta sp.]